MNDLQRLFFDISKKKHIIKRILLIFAIVFCCLWKIPFSYDINKNLTALKVNGQDESGSEVDIKIYGKYKKYILGDDKFSGNIVIEGYGFTNDQYKVGISLNPYVMDSLYYKKFNVERIEVKTFGFILADNDFESFAILPYKEYIEDPFYTGSRASLLMDGDTITTICYPAKTRDEAVEIANKMIGKRDIHFIMK